MIPINGISKIGEFYVCEKCGLNLGFSVVIGKTKKEVENHICKHNESSLKQDLTVIDLADQEVSVYTIVE